MAKEPHQVTISAIEAHKLDLKFKARVKSTNKDLLLKDIYSVDAIYKRAKREKFYLALRRAQLLEHIKTPKPVHRLLAEKLALVEFKYNELKRLYGNAYTFIGSDKAISRFICDYEYVNYLLIAEMNLLAESLSTLFNEGAIKIGVRRRK